ncbi:MAG: ATP-binding protein [Bacteroidetes bacterium]|nr:ATP-binding protein [Bacteroidota bacterium]
MINRTYDKRIGQMLRQFPVVCLLGPRQSGKTTAAKLYARSSRKPVLYLDMESPADGRRLADAEYTLKQFKDHLVIIDEIQFRPDLFPLLRHLVDDFRKPGRFLILGSASPELVKGASESLAGRVYYIDTHPLNAIELKDQNNYTQTRHWFRGGFPDAWLARTDSAWRDWMDGFSRTFVERDLNNLFGVTFSNQLMHKLWHMLAHHHGGLWNAQSFAKGLDVSPTTINRYTDYLVGAFMLRKLQPYYAHSRKRLLKTPKVYFRDSGLLHYLLELPNSKSLQLHPVLGYSWEGYVIEQICQLLNPRIQPYYYRTQDGSEMDLVLTRGAIPHACIEIKSTRSPSVSRGMRESIQDLQTQHNYIIVPGSSEPYYAESKIKVMGIEAFLEKDYKRITK